MRTADEQRMVAELRKQIDPVIEQTLIDFVRALATNFDEASAAEIARCIEVVESCKKLPSDSSSITLVWNAALEAAVERLRGWQRASAAGKDDCAS